MQRLLRSFDRLKIYLRTQGTGALVRYPVKTTEILLLVALLLVGVVEWSAMHLAIQSVAAPPSREAAAVVPIFRFVNIGKGREGTSRPNAMVWQTSTALEDCAQVIDARKRNEKRAINDLVRLQGNLSVNREDHDPCAPFQLGEVPHGTKVEVVGECGRMARIRILSGSLQGREGCIETNRLSEAAG